MVASIRFQNGSLGQLTGSFGAGGNSERFTAYGDGYTVFVESTSRGQGRIMRGSREVESLGPVDTVQLQIRHFIDCVREDKEPLNSSHDAVRIVRFMWDIMDAAGIGIPPAPDDDRGWLLWCACGERVIPRLDRCPNCGQEWAGWSLPRDEVRRV